MLLKVQNEKRFKYSTKEYKIAHNQFQIPVDYLDSNTQLHTIKNWLYMTIYTHAARKACDTRLTANQQLSKQLKMIDTCLHSQNCITFFLCNTKILVPLNPKVFLPQTHSNLK